MAGFQCPYCSMVMPISKDTYQKVTTSFEQTAGGFFSNSVFIADDSCIENHFYKCPNCGQYTINVIGIGKMVKDVSMNIRPLSSAKQFPDYVPKTIRQDYEEACAIVNLSPKSSATLSRRCLQGMIRDFWSIRKNRLVDEIDALQEKVPASQWKVLNSLRRIGNIGAHPEADINLIIDIEPSEAKKLISVIELLIKQWYIERHEQEILYAEVLALDEDAKSAKKTE